MIWPTRQDYSRVPEQMRDDRCRRWVVFKCVRSPSGKVNKTPMQPNGSTNVGCDGVKRFDPEKAIYKTVPEWFGFEECLTAIEYGVGTALGFALTGYSMVCVDLDHSINVNGTITPTAKKWLDFMKEYDPFVERSISGNGMHIFAWYGDKRRLHPNPEPGVEVYTTDRFVVMTGVPL